MISIWTRLGLLALLGGLAFSASMHASAQAKFETFSGEYVVSLLGLTVARAQVEGRFEDGKFALESRITSAGLALIFDSTKATETSSGGFVGLETQPSAFHADYSSGRKKQMTRLSLAGGAVTTIENVPPLKVRGGDWVPVEDSHLKGVVDPLSAGLIKASGTSEVCGRTIRVFDGEFVMDAVLEAVPDAKPIAGYDESVTCRVRIRAVAGYRKGRKSLDYLENRSRILIGFAPLGTTGVFAPVHARIGTQIGTITVKVRRQQTQ